VLFGNLPFLTFLLIGSFQKERLKSNSTIPLLKRSTKRAIAQSLFRKELQNEQQKERSHNCSFKKSKKVR